MPSRSRRSLLQREILMQLEKGPATTVTALAQALQRERTTVGRSLRSLATAGLVYKDADGWHLTETGQGEAHAIAPRLSADVERSSRALMRKWAALPAVDSAVMQQIATLAASSPLQEFSRSPLTGVAGILEQFDKIGLTNIQRIVDQSSGDLAVAMTSIGAISARQPPDFSRFLVTTDLADGIGHSFTSLAAQTARFAEVSSAGHWLISLVDAQQCHADLFKHVVGVNSVAEIVGSFSRTNVLLSRAVENASRTYELMAQRTLGMTFEAVQPSGLLAAADQLSAAYATLLQDQLTGLPLRATPLPSLVPSYLTLPTVTVAGSSGSVRQLVEAAYEEDDAASAEAEPQDSDHILELDQLLAEIDPDYVDRRRGAWQALTTDNPERVRHAAISQRELLTHMLRRLVPDISVKEDGEPGSEMRARVKKILDGSDSGADFADAATRSVYAIYRWLNKPVHTTYRHEQSLRLVCIAHEALLAFILVNRRKE